MRRLSALLALASLPPAALLVPTPAPALAEVAPGTTPGSATGLYGAYDDHNAFARILKGTLPATMVYQDRRVVAFMNIHPLSTGDLLVIPRQHARNLLDIDPAVLAHLIAVTQRLARAQAKALHPGGIFLRQNSGEDADQTVFHFHMHVTPVYPGVPLAKTSYGQPPADPAELAAVAARIRAALR